MESTLSDRESGSLEPGTRSSAGEHALHTGGVVGSIPTASTIPEPSWVYFVRAKTVGLIKIGIANLPRRRLNALQVGSPDKLEIIGLIRARDHADLERHLHSRFSRHRQHGEWFSPDPALVKFIDENAVPEDVAIACHLSTLFWRLQGVTDLMPKYNELVAQWRAGEALQDVARPALPAPPEAEPRAGRRYESPTLRAYKDARGIKLRG